MGGGLSSATVYRVQKWMERLCTASCPTSPPRVRLRLQHAVCCTPYASRDLQTYLCALYDATVTKLKGHEGLSGKACECSALLHGVIHASSTCVRLLLRSLCNLRFEMGQSARVPAFVL